jgi:hypothetical protein
MSKNTRTLSGAAKNTYLDGIVRSALGDDHDARERLMRELMSAVASLRVRVEADRGRSSRHRTVEADAYRPSLPASTSAVAATDNFDPYTPNVIVVLRTKGRDAALLALSAITREDHLRQLSHEQQLSVPADARSVADLRLAIVTAAERRVANRQAAGR